ncbi:hypothetical protein TBLA_0I03320 [Henningerozyma blattae CBS 6284]|uniref:Uncharacterized protein n=1 Tax=Henningerozyma blattae (strain ATCC 34711 / CBS 6284 / DSM 70876 / NBRC 10599 / NRRL Y-10934 / UCD 77-7) TaxID=1071380 RepID=I2H9D5_HENB6|nr:hypothetical protein TBLA_0I03320 [Tetrapisispora blattae CBS 6284]CCH62987.1 hypothetical protein TBLA_0I03320 [Tetrapisispora blattae CBS 6284]
MDYASQKNDRRRQFQERRSLKARHETPTARKHRLQNSAQNNEELVPQEVLLPSNESRYEELGQLGDSLEDSEQAEHLRTRARDAAAAAEARSLELTTNSTHRSVPAKKQLAQLDTADLNNILQKGMSEGANAKSNRSVNTSANVNTSTDADDGVTTSTTRNTQKIISPSYGPSRTFYKLTQLLPSLIQISKTIKIS